MGLIFYLKISVSNYRFTLYDMPELCRSLLHRGGSQKSRLVSVFRRCLGFPNGLLRFIVLIFLKIYLRPLFRMLHAHSFPASFFDYPEKWCLVKLFTANLATFLLGAHIFCSPLLSVVTKFIIMHLDSWIVICVYSRTAAYIEVVRNYTSGCKNSDHGSFRFAMVQCCIFGDLLEGRLGGGSSTISLTLPVGAKSKT